MMKRRKFLKNFSGLVGVGLLTGGYTWQIEPFWLEFVHVKMPIANLPEPLIGKTLMQISDIHVGNRFDRKFIIDSFHEAKKFEPDFVAYTGDYVTYESEEQYVQLTEVMQHAVHGKLGTVGVLGNHDYGPDWQHLEIADVIAAIMENAGVAILKHGQKMLEGLNFIGIDDWKCPRFYPVNVFKEYDPQQANVVLCHNPDVCDLGQYIWQGYKGWILSGHTHGGQCKIPFLEPPILPVTNRRYTSGLIEIGDGRTLYINRALGHSIQVRFNVRPEITLFHLEKQEGKLSS